MPESAENLTDFLILRKAPYQDHALIVSGISPQLGQMAFFMRQSTGTRRSYRSFDLFQEVNVNWRRSSGELYYCQRAEIIADYAAVAGSQETFNTACTIARFALANTLQRMPVPKFYQALRVALERLGAGTLPADAILTGVGLTFLNEAGWLACSNTAEAAQCQLLLNMAAGGDYPALTPENWSELWNWTRQRLAASELEI